MIRPRHLRLEPFCRQCHAEGRPGVVGTVVDHVIPHRGAEWLFEMPENLQTLCKPCHDVKSGREAHMDLDARWPLAPSPEQFATWLSEPTVSERPRLAEFAYAAHIRGIDFDAGHWLPMAADIDQQAYEAMRRRGGDA